MERREPGRKLRAIVHPTKLRLLQLIRRLESPWLGNLTTESRLPESTVMYHLAPLREAGLIEAKVEVVRVKDRSGPRGLVGRKRNILRFTEKGLQVFDLLTALNNLLAKPEGGRPNA